MSLASQLRGAFQGLGWGITDVDGTRVLGHDGGTIGQYAVLRVTPDADLVVCGLTNGPGGPAAMAELSRYVFDEAAGITLPKPPEPPDPPHAIDAARYAGTYERLSMSIEVAPGDDGAPLATATPTGALVQLGARPATAPMVPLDDRRFVMTSPAGPTVAEFLDFDDAGHPAYLYLGGRVARRTD